MEQDIDKIKERGQEWIEQLKPRMPSLLSPSYWEDYLVQNLFESHEFQNQLFRFVDVYPSLNNASEISDHFRAYLETLELSPAVDDVLKLATTPLSQGLCARLIKFSIEKMARKYILAEDLTSNRNAIKSINQQGYSMTFDVLGEATLTESEASDYAQLYMNMIEQSNGLSLSTQANFSLKCTALVSNLSICDHAQSVERLYRALMPILRKAKELQVFINIDMEQCDYHNIIYDSFALCVLDESLIDYESIGIVVQAYTLESQNRLESLCDLAKKREAKFAIRLVKGAYWDYEVAMARQRAWEIPVFTTKSDSDRQFEKLSTYLLENSEYLYPAIATHNLRSMIHVSLEAERLCLSKCDFEFQMLYGMAPAFGDFILEQGYLCRIYCPLGEMIPGMGYLVRRLLENSSNTGFLQKFHAGVDLVSLLEHCEDPSPVREDAHSYDKAALLDFNQKETRVKFKDMLEKWQLQFPKEIVLEKGFFNAEQTYEIKSPNTEATIGKIEFLHLEHLKQQIDLAASAYRAWDERPLKDRVKCIEKCAELMEMKRYELASLMCHEVGKNWSEADADVVEAIDFCRFYASRAQKELGEQEVISLPGESNTYTLHGRGVCAVISPWNFPLAILCGMSSSALLAGNPVILKPAEQSGLIAYEYYQLLLEAGIPKDVVHFSPCDGEKVFSQVCQNPKIKHIAFTGSKEVGLELYEKAAKPQKGYSHLQMVFAEMGGKNSAYVDDDADFDEVIPNILYSAFAFSGQKCSALSRLFIHKNIKQALIERLCKSMDALKMDVSTHPGCDVSPIIDAISYKRILNLLQEAEQDPSIQCLTPKRKLPQNGYFIAPCMYEVSDIHHKFMQEEFFAPILTIMEVESFQAGLEAINRSSFGLTASVYSRHPDRIKQARQICEVGNLYINRGCTGAIVGRQPFGGVKLSGTGIKAGGVGYLKQFTEAKTITENTCRHGFVSHDV